MSVSSDFMLREFTATIKNSLYEDSNYQSDSEARLGLTMRRFQR